MSEKEDSVVGGRHAKIALGLLVVVYIFNFVDRQIISILAEDIKADLGISKQRYWILIRYCLWSLLLSCGHSYGEIS